MIAVRTQQERRAISALFRALDNRDEPQYRALDRLQRLVSEEFAFDVWLSTKPDPKLVDQVITARLLSMSSLFKVMPVRKELSWLADTVKVNRSTSQW